MKNDNAAALLILHEAMPKPHIRLMLRRLLARFTAFVDDCLFGEEEAAWNLYRNFRIWIALAAVPAIFCEYALNASRNVVAGVGLFGAVIATGLFAFCRYRLHLLNKAQRDADYTVIRPRS